MIPYIARIDTIPVELPSIPSAARNALLQCPANEDPSPLLLLPAPSYIRLDF